MTLLAASWLLFGITHSLLAGTTLNRIFGRYGRLAFNCIAVVMTALPFAISASIPAHMLWDEPGYLRRVRYGIDAAVVLAFISTLKYYSMPGFLGLRVETWPLTFSPWHQWVRHPWYFLSLIYIWAQPLTDTWLVSAFCMTLYFVLGSRMEERRILRCHPASYAEYCRIVPGLIPWRGCALDAATRQRLEALALSESGG